MAGSKRILVTNRAGIGDVILSTPIFKALKDKFPDSHLAVLVGSNVYDLLKGLSFIDEIITYERGRDSVWSIIKKIWRYDVAICLDFTYRSALFAFLAAIPLRAGLRHKRGLFLNRPVERDAQQEFIYEPYNYAGIIQRSLQMTLEGDLTKLFVSPATPQDLQSVDSLFKEAKLSSTAKIITIVPFSSADAKNWPLENVQSLIRQLRHNYNCEIVLLGSAADRPKSEKLVDGVNWLGRTTLTEMAEIIRRSDLFIGHCSGPIHIAAATQTPIIALYGATSSAHWAPKNRTVVVEHPLSCTPCDATGFQCDHKQCMQSITLEEVLTACKTLLPEK
ncbi:MAG: lipopolysaccharide heptosyltransferase II [Sporomusaceae bacterium]|nr:lipopolysaccharide heptosyltransferase II [Sporomusaceae bacterium]